jgi:hypothetical protein
MIKQPIGVYINWASYDELSDNVELTQELAMDQLDHMIRLRKAGAKLDYYMMDAFWYAKDGGYREWRKPHWPKGPDAWLKKCKENGIKPGLWVSCNTTFCKLDPIPAWENSMEGGNRVGACMFKGGFLNDFLDALHMWYEKGVRMFKFDFVNFSMITPELKGEMMPADIRRLNIAAWSAGLKAFRVKHPEVVMIAYNGLEVTGSQGNTSTPIGKALETNWLEVFDSVYCGDPRPADVPAMRFWRSKDVYSDHQVRVYEYSGFPLERIDNAGFMVGLTGTCYGRGMQAWKGMLILSLARGGWVNTYYGNLNLIKGEDAKWFAKVQKIWMGLQEFGRTELFGGWPAKGEAYGILNKRYDGAIVTVVNPGQNVSRVAFDSLGHGKGRVLFCDAGFKVGLKEGEVTVGPEQMVVIGLGSFADAAYDLGVQEDVVIPKSIEKVPVVFASTGVNALAGKATGVKKGTLRFAVKLCSPDGLMFRISGGSPPKGTPMGQIITLKAVQGGKELPIKVEYDKQIWSGLSWGVGEVDVGSGDVEFSVKVNHATTVVLSGEVFKVGY